MQQIYPTSISSGLADRNRRSFDDKRSWTTVTGSLTDVAVPVLGNLSLNEKHPATEETRATR